METIDYKNFLGVANINNGKNQIKARVLDVTFLIILYLGFVKWTWMLPIKVTSGNRDLSLLMWNIRRIFSPFSTSELVYV